MLIQKCLCSGMTPGKTVTVTGSVDADPDRFAINFHAKKDIIFHLNPRFRENVIVCNNLEDNVWASEEHFPLHNLEKGKAFKVKISCTEDAYEVAINGKLAFSFKHRFTDFHLIEQMVISGDISVMSVYIE